MASCFFLPE